LYSFIYKIPLQIAQFYNIREEEMPPTYNLRLTTTEETLNSYTVNVCTR